MPEGPEIKRLADRLSKVLVDQELTEVDFAFDHLKPFGAILQEQTILSVDSRAKALLISFSDGHVTYSHNQLFGRWYIRKLGNLPKTNRSLRLAIHTQTHSALLYSASDIEVLDSADVNEHPFIRKLGIDLLSESTKLNAVKKVVNDPAYARRQLGALLLDQSFLAGLGNYLRSEILFLAGLRPEQKLGKLTKKQRDGLAKIALETTVRAYRQSAVTLSPSLVKKLEKTRKKGSRKPRHYVFGRAGQKCYHCSERIVKAEHSGRRIYICSNCQPDNVIDQN